MVALAVVGFFSGALIGIKGNNVTASATQDAMHAKMTQAAFKVTLSAISANITQIVLQETKDAQATQTVSQVTQAAKAIQATQTAYYVTQAAKTAAAEAERLGNVVEADSMVESGGDQPKEALQLTGTPQHLIVNRECGEYSSRLKIGMQVIALSNLNVYSKPEFQQNRSNTDPPILMSLKEGEWLRIVRHDEEERVFFCYHNSLFWQVETEDGTQGWALEYYAPHKYDNPSIRQHFRKGYYLKPYPKDQSSGSS